MNSQNSQLLIYLTAMVNIVLEEVHEDPQSVVAIDFSPALQAVFLAKQILRLGGESFDPLPVAGQLLSDISGRVNRAFG